jgi:uncharacterized protein YndB with AHSA1/START domain
MRSGGEMMAGDRLELRLKRILPAPMAAVYRALSDPGELAKWWGPRGFTAPSVEFDPQVGGSYQIRCSLRMAIPSTSRESSARSILPPVWRTRFAGIPPIPTIGRRWSRCLSTIEVREVMGRRFSSHRVVSPPRNAARYTKKAGPTASGGWSRCSARHRIDRDVPDPTRPNRRSPDMTRITWSHAACELTAVRLRIRVSPEPQRVSRSESTWPTDGSVRPSSSSR